MDLLTEGPDDASVDVLLAHGAGAPMDTAWMNAISKSLASERLRVLRFEFDYMAARRSGQRRAPPKAERLQDEYLRAVDLVVATRPLIIGGKSMAGRVASMVADALHR